MASGFTPKTTLPKQYETYDFISPSRFVGKLKGKVAVVTGASAGLGKEAALAFAAAGANVACVARRESLLHSLASEISTKYGVAAAAIVADLSDPSAAKRILEQVQRELGPVDILLNNAGIQRFGPLAAEEDLEKWWRVFEINVRAPAALIHAVLPSMIERKTGILITVSSSAGAVDIPYMTAYGASKAAIIKLHQTLAQEIARHGILSYSIHPGTVVTELAAVEGAINTSALAGEPAAQKMLEAFLAETKFQSPRLMADACVAICAEKRFEVLNGRFVDCEQGLEQVLEDAETGEGGRVGKEGLYRLRVDEL